LLTSFVLDSGRPESVASEPEAADVSELEEQPDTKNTLNVPTASATMPT
jgi:hypothetical protein